MSDLVNPSTRAQLLSYRKAEVERYADGGFSVDRGQAMTVATSGSGGLTAVHRLYRARNSDFFYTADAAEVRRAVDSHGYADHGVAFYASRAPGDCRIAVYSFYRRGVHRYSTNPGDRAVLRDAGWKVEAVRFYAGRPQVDSVFSLGVIPDTQQEVLRAGDRRFKQRSDWLVAAKSALDLKFVTHTGDIVNWDTPDHVQYRRARTALQPLKAGKVPYSLSPGNHDTGAVCAGGGACDPTETRTLIRETTSLNRFLADGTAALGGRYQDGKVDNTYSLFRAGGSSWLVLNLELWPRKEVVAWGKRVVASHPDHNVIVVTHSYLTASGAIYQSSGYGGVSPQYLFDHLVKAYPNVRVVLSGHTGKAATRTDVGVEGNRIVSLLLTMHDKDTNPLRLVEVNTAADTLDTWVYAPFTAQSYRGYSRSFANMSWID